MHRARPHHVPMDIADQFVSGLGRKVPSGHSERHLALVSDRRFAVASDRGRSSIGQDPLAPLAVRQTNVLIANLEDRAQASHLFDRFQIGCQRFDPVERGDHRDIDPSLIVHLRKRSVRESVSATCPVCGSQREHRSD